MWPPQTTCTLRTSNQRRPWLRRHFAHLTLHHSHFPLHLEAFFRVGSRPSVPSLYYFCRNGAQCSSALAALIGRRLGSCSRFWYSIASRLGLFTVAQSLYPGGTPPTHTYRSLFEHRVFALYQGFRPICPWSRARHSLGRRRRRTLHQCTLGWRGSYREPPHEKLSRNQPYWCTFRRDTRRWE